ncbi:MAG: aspartate--tRNA ligase [Rhodothermales bacterium]|nr:aspartate--tRNA ligase [Rhodothermales bacterium]
MTQASISPVDTHPARTHTCGALRDEFVGSDVVLKGWVDTRRDLGGVIFIDLRDRYGLTQIVFSPQDDLESYQVAESLRNEYVISVRGTVSNRSAETINDRMPTGRVEVRVSSVVLLNESEPLPFQVSSHEQKAVATNEDLRLRYRYLDLRRPDAQDKLILRHKMYQATRRYFDSQSFVEVETPVLMKSTPEGARDYLVPSRVHPGKFYALPQSPQTYKQILMIAGLDRYFQIVKCFRDEDLRADRQPEFTQIDVEMSFATEDLIYELTEGLLKAIWSDVMDVDVPVPFPRLTYQDALETYGSDKPDTRFGLKIHNVSHAFADSGFRVFDNILESDGRIVAIVVPGEGDRGRGWMDKLDKEIVRKTIGAGGLIYFKLPSDGSETYSSVKSEVLPSQFVDAAVSAVGAESGDLVLVLAGTNPTVYEQMGALRLHLGRDLGLIDEAAWNFLWVTEFPLLEWDEEASRFFAMHHPFTSPHPDDLELMHSDAAKTRARAYDVVLNGTEIGGGSIRINTADVQRQMFNLLDIDEVEAQARFGFLLDAFKYGAPPHGGIAMGFDRIVMLAAGAKSLREVIAFPKTQRAQELMVNSPDIVDENQLKDLHIRVVEEEKK